MQNKQYLFLWKHGFPKGGRGGFRHLGKKIPKKPVFWGGMSPLNISLCSLEPTKLIHFGIVFLIFLTLPYVGKIRKIKKPFKIWIVWSVEAGKVKGIFFSRNFELIFRFFFLRKKIQIKSNGPAKAEIISKLSIF